MISTPRLVLRRFRMDDAPLVQKLAGAPEIARNTLLIPYPYPDGEAERWIATHDSAMERGDHAFAITLDDALVGAIGLNAKLDHDRAEIGYWIGLPYWGRGYATEAARAIVKHGFEKLGLHRMYAMHFTRNPASGRVLQKIGMRHEGSLRHHLKKDGEYIDVEMYGILRDDEMSD
jgi:ribosomal-protein-alanine N-acetyltransferase